MLERENVVKGNRRLRVGGGEGKEDGHFCCREKKGNGGAGDTGGALLTPPIYKGNSDLPV